MNPSFEHQTLRVHQQMALSSFDLLGPIVTRSLPPTPVVLIDWLSTIVALGLGFLFRRTLTRSRRAECILSQVPSMRHLLK
jgi:hypothetical protein